MNAEEMKEKKIKLGGIANSLKDLQRRRRITMKKIMSLQGRLDIIEKEEESLYKERKELKRK